ncbi:hypothetical protein [Marinobacter orientalis]|uniref:Uncharacterized protein n=1 Tax=Marinobacter orientalis TaxID=1928859 RepID=A0A7Y0RFI1_9GAMM|nr:hypothetical protein [Marinobacter orientalis]NMT65302.1 hypothetical protein [Marinobacter orientalis]TGX47928.1 hypothetical protein DIT72_17070 [Marinobacter orientalis]
MSNACACGRGQDKRPVHIVIIELHHHSELIQNLIRVLDLERFEMSLITVPEVLEKVDVVWADEADWLSAFCKGEDETVVSFIERMRPVFESADLLYFNTVRHFWDELCNIPFSAPAIIRIHNAHADLAPASHFDRPLLKFPAIFSHVLRRVWIAGEWRQRTRFFSHISYFMFPNQAITDYVSEQGWVSKGRILPPVMPFGFLGDRDHPVKKAQRERVTIAITGKVTNAKKDYHLVYQALKQCISKLKVPLRLVLLGKAADRQAARIVADFKSLESGKFSLDYSNNYVSSDEFDKKVFDVDFLLAPIKVQTHFRKYREVYGKSKMSGIENDILLYRKPSLVTSGYVISGDIDKAVEYFEPTPESLAESLISWVNHGEYQNLGAAFNEMNNYRPEIVAESFYGLCEKLIPSGPAKSKH